MRRLLQAVEGSHQADRDNTPVRDLLEEERLETSVPGRRSVLRKHQADLGVPD